MDGWPECVRNGGRWLCSTIAMRGALLTSAPRVLVSAPHSRVVPPYNQKIGCLPLLLHDLVCAWPGTAVGYGTDNRRTCSCSKCDLVIRRLRCGGVCTAFAWCPNLVDRSRTFCVSISSFFGTSFCIVARERERESSPVRLLSLSENDLDSGFEPPYHRLHF